LKISNVLIDRELEQRNCV